MQQVLAIDQVGKARNPFAFEFYLHEPKDQPANRTDDFKTALALAYSITSEYQVCVHAWA